MRPVPIVVFFPIKKDLPVICTFPLYSLKIEKNYLDYTGNAIYAITIKDQYLLIGHCKEDIPINACNKKEARQ